jgi:glycerate-2-kinase
LKGGKLAKLAFPAQVVALILSDIVDDPIELVTTNALLES